MPKVRSIYNIKILAKKYYTASLTHLKCFYHLCYMSRHAEQSITHINDLPKHLHVFKNLEKQIIVSVFYETFACLLIALHTSNTTLHNSYKKFTSQHKLFIRLGALWSRSSSLEISSKCQNLVIAHFNTFMRSINTFTYTAVF